MNVKLAIGITIGASLLAGAAAGYITGSRNGAQKGYLAGKTKGIELGEQLGRINLAGDILEIKREKNMNADEALLQLYKNSPILHKNQ